MELRSENVRVVLFDFDDTIFAYRDSSRDGLATYLASLGGALAAAEPNRSYALWLDLEERHYERYTRGELDHLGQRRVRTRDFLAHFDMTLESDADVDAWFAGFLASFEREWRAYDDVAPCLQALASRRLGIITNGKLDVQLHRVNALGLSVHFEHVVASSEVGAAKPAREIFLHASDAFGTAPGEIAYVGDRLHTDAIAAATAGLLGVWLDRSGSATASDRAIAAEHQVPIISSLSDLPSLFD